MPPVVAGAALLQRVGASPLSIALRARSAKYQRYVAALAEHRGRLPAGGAGAASRGLGAFRLLAAFPTGKRKKVNRYFNKAAAAWESGACVLPAAKRQPVAGPYHSPDAIERHRCWL